MEKTIEQLTALARSMGASDVQVISPGVIKIRDELAKLCKENRCPEYGLSRSCPPEVAGPAAFRELKKRYDKALVIRMVVPSAALFSHERPEIMQLLHEIVSGVELAAKKMGYDRAMAFAGGSCKSTFCREFANCRVLFEGGQCRNPDAARPSMSGFGIDVKHLMAACGWPVDIANADETENGTMSWVAGLILLD